MTGGSPHRMINPEALMPPIGFTHAVSAAPGRTVYVAGQGGYGADGTLVGEDLVEQFERACECVVEALGAAGGRPEHVVSMQIFVTEVAAYRDRLGEIGAAYRKHFGKHFPAMALLHVSGLLDPEAKVEIQATAVIPD